jgi:hypothetical protein
MEQISKQNIDLLESLRNQFIDISKRWGMPEFEEVWKSYDLNDLITVLHLGFSEKDFFDSLLNEEVKGEPIFYSTEEIKKIYQQLIRLKTQGT